MQVEELFDLTTWVLKEITAAQIIPLYQKLHQILSQNAQPSQQKQPFETEKDNLTTALLDVQLSTLSSGQLEILSAIGIAKHVGEEGAETLEEVFHRNALDIATAADKVIKAIQEISNGVQWITQTREVLSKIIDEEAIQDLNDSVLLRVHFQKDAHLSNITEFKNWGKIWYDIGRGIAMAHGTSPEEIQVIGASKGSIILSLLTTYGIAKTTSGIILEALKVVEKGLDIRKTVEEIRALKIGNDEAAKLLIRDAEALKQKGVEDIVAMTVSELKLNDGTQGEKINAIGTAVKKLVDFIEKGGEVDFVIPDEAENESEETEKSNKNPAKKSREELRVIFKEVRQIEEKVKQIGYKND